jgi:hypothetical protein
MLLERRKNFSFFTLRVLQKAVGIAIKTDNAKSSNTSIYVERESEETAGCTSVLLKMCSEVKEIRLLNNAVVNSCWNEKKYDPMGIKMIYSRANELILTLNIFIIIRGIVSVQKRLPGRREGKSDFPSSRQKRNECIIKKFCEIAKPCSMQFL